MTALFAILIWCALSVLVTVALLPLFRASASADDLSEKIAHGDVIKFPSFHPHSISNGDQQNAQ